MSITANHLIYDVLEIASSGGLPSEFKISNEQILYWIEQTYYELKIINTRNRIKKQLH